MRILTYATNYIKRAIVKTFYKIYDYFFPNGIENDYDTFRFMFWCSFVGSLTITVAYTLFYKLLYILGYSLLYAIMFTGIEILLRMYNADAEEDEEEEEEKEYEEEKEKEERDNAEEDEYKDNDEIIIKTV